MTFAGTAPFPPFPPSYSPYWGTCRQWQPPSEMMVEAARPAERSERAERSILVGEGRLRYSFDLSFVRTSKDS